MYLEYKSDYTLLSIRLSVAGRETLIADRSSSSNPFEALFKVMISPAMLS